MKDCSKCEITCRNCKDDSPVYWHKQRRIDLIGQNGNDGLHYQIMISVPRELLISAINHCPDETTKHLLEGCLKHAL